MPTRKAEGAPYGLGLALFLATILGGGAASGLWTDTVLKAAIILAAAPFLAAREGAPVDRRVAWMCALGLASIAFQLLPLPEALLRAFRGELYALARPEAWAGRWGFVSLGLGRTLDALLYTGALVALLLALLRLPLPRLRALLPFWLAGVACSGALALVQYSAPGGASIEGILPYTMTAGTFANRNHLVSLLCLALPFLFHLATFERGRVPSCLAIAFLLLVLLAAGSRAGVLIGMAALVLTIPVFAARSRIGVAGFVALAVCLGLYAAGTWSLLEMRELTDAARARFAATTIEGIRDNWLLGIGYGNMAAAYPVYEDASAIGRTYVNHVHNDYLELAFEGGLAGVLLILAYGGLVFSRLMEVSTSHIRKAAVLGILFVLVHSAVDYPLRTMAVAVAFVYLNALLFHRGADGTSERSRSSERVMSSRARRT